MMFGNNPPVPVANPLGALALAPTDPATAAPSTNGFAPQGQQNGFMDKMMSPMALMSLSMIANSGPSLTPKTGFEGVPQALVMANQHKRQQQEYDMRAGALQKAEAEKAEKKAALNRTAQYFSKKLGLSYEDTLALYQTGGMQALKQASGAGGGSYKVVGGQLFNEETGEWLSPPGGNAARGGLGVTWGVGPDGEPIAMQTRSDGTMVPYDLPEGVSASSPFHVSRDRAAGSAYGKRAGEAQFTFTGKAPGIENSLRLVDEVINHPSLSDAVGPIDGRLPSFTAGSRDFDERVEQLKGEAFMAARQELKGGGQITDYEGQRAEAALVRASQAKSEADFVKAMNEFKDAITRGYEQLAKQAGQDPETQRPTVRYTYNPETGEIE